MLDERQWVYEMTHACDDHPNRKSDASPLSDGPRCAGEGPQGGVCRDEHDEEQLGERSGFSLRDAPSEWTPALSAS
jgi:hypothetical protein